MRSPSFCRTCDYLVAVLVLLYYHAPPPGTHPELASLNNSLLNKFAPKLYGTTAGYETKTLEVNFTGSVRVSFDGTRSLAAFDFQAAHKYLVSLLHVDGKADPDIAAGTVVNTLSKWDKSQLEAFRQATGHAAIFYGTIGPQDAFYVPQAWGYVELNGSERPNFGVLLPVLLRGPCMEPLEYVNQYFTKRNTPQKELSTAITEVKGVVIEKKPAIGGGGGAAPAPGADKGGGGGGAAPAAGAVEGGGGGAAPAAKATSCISSGHL